jgi:hypothetical protein
MKPSNKLPPAVFDLAVEAGLIRMTTDYGPVMIRDITFEQFEKFVATLGQRWLGINTPFICGGSEEKDAWGLPKTLLVCPAYGADGMCVYEKKGEYSAPSY